MIKYGYGDPIIIPKGIHYNKNKKCVKLPQIAIGVFSRYLFKYIIKQYNGEKVGYFTCANMQRGIYLINFKNKKYTLFLAGVSAPIISGDIEELSSEGVNTFIIFGNCGVLDENIADCQIVIPNKSYREEGTSYHYIAKKGVIDINPNYISIFTDILNQYSIDYIIGATWTTDAFYRETADKVDYYKKLGVITVEMETSAIACVCKKKKLNYFTFYYAGDFLSNAKWDRRSLSGKSNISEKIKVVTLAMELADKISTL